MQPTTVSSGYLIPKLKECPSEYAFNTDKQVLRAPVQTYSEYQFPELNPWKAAVPSNCYHYVQSNEIPPRTNTSQYMGNPISLAQLKDKINHMDTGYYRPAVVDGVLYFVQSESLTTTSRSFPSDSEKTGVELTATGTAREAPSETNLKTGRLPSTPTVKKNLSDVKLSMSQLRKLLGRELFREVIRKYKKEHGVKTEEEVLEGSTAKEISSKTQLRTAESNVTAIPHSDTETSSKDVDTARTFGVLDSAYSTRTALDDDQMSSKDVETARTFGVLDSAYSTITAVEWEGNVTSSKDVMTAVSFGVLDTQVSANTAIEDVTSSKDVQTAKEYMGQSFKTGIERTEAITSSKDVETAKIPTENSTNTGMDAITSSKDVITAKVPTERSTITGREAITSSKDVETAKSFRTQASTKTAAGQDAITSINEMNTAKAAPSTVRTGLSYAAVASSKDVDTALEPSTQASNVTLTKIADKDVISAKSESFESITSGTSSVESTETTRTGRTTSTGSDLSSEMNSMVNVAQKHLGESEKMTELEPNALRSMTEVMGGSYFGRTPDVFDARAAQGLDVIGSLVDAGNPSPALDIGTRTARELTESQSETSVVTAIEN